MDDFNFNFDELEEQKDDILPEDDMLDFGLDEEQQQTEQKIEEQQVNKQQVQQTQQVQQEQEPKQQKIEPKQNIKKENSYVLYIISDKKALGILDYFRNFGISVSKVFTDIDTAKSALLMQVEPTRIVVMDTGTGKFTSMGTRRKLVDLLGISDESNKISVFYTDSVIKSEADSSLELEDKAIQWYKYRSTADVLAHLLQYSRKENYVYDMDKQEDTVETDILNFKGLNMETGKKINIGEPIITPAEIAINVDSESHDIEQLKVYNINV